MFIDLDEAPCLVVGAGPVALRRTRSLMGCGARVTVVAPRFAAGFGALGAAIVRLERPFGPADLQGMRLCVAATDDHPLNAHIADLCQNQHIAVNVASDARLGTFHFPALVQRELSDITIASSAKAKFRMTSDRYMNPNNAPSEFDKLAMNAIRESGASEYSEVRGGQP